MPADAGEMRERKAYEPPAMTLRYGSGSESSAAARERMLRTRADGMGVPTTSVRDIALAVTKEYEIDETAAVSSVTGFMTLLVERGFVDPPADAGERE